MGIQNAGGFECGNADECRSLTGSSTFSTTTARTGTYSYQCAPVTTGTANVRIGGLGTDGRAVNDLAVATLYTRVYMNIGVGLSSSNEEVLVILDTAGANKAQVRLDSNRKLSVYDTVGLVATGTTVLSTGTWYRIELMTTTGAGASAYELRIDGATELSGTGTFNNVNHGSIRLGKGTNRNGQGYTVYFDDYQLRDDAWPGDSQVKVLLPDGNGSVTQWTAGTNSSNYLEVDEIPADDGTTYIQKSASGDQTHYVTFENCSAKSISGTINAVKLFTKSAESASITSATRARMNSGGTAVEGSSFNGSTTWVTQMLLRETDPATSAAWTTTGIDGLEGGVRDTAASGNVRCTAISLMVDYTPSTTQTVTTNAPSAGSQLYQPAVSATASIATSAPSSGSQVFNATVTPGAVTISTAAPSAASSVPQPSVSAANTVTASAPSAASSVSQPTVTASNAIAASLLSSGASVPLATVTQDSADQTITTAAPSAGSTVPQPSLSATASITAASPSSGSAVNQPTVSATASVSASLLGSGSAVFAPAVTPGTVTVTGAAPSSGALVPSPAVESVATLAASIILSEAAVFPPAVEPGEVTVSAALVSPTATVFEPEVSGGITYPGISLDWTPGYPSEPELHYSPRGRPLHWSGGNRLHWSPRSNG